MKFTIHGFDQNTAIKLGLDNDDLLILRWFVDFAGTRKMIKEIIDGQPFYWIKYEGLLAALPILNIKQDSLFRKLKKMASVGVLEHCTANKKGRYSLYGFGVNYNALTSTDATIVPLRELEKHSEKNPSEYTEKIPSVQSEKNPSKHSEKNPKQIISLLSDYSINSKTDCLSILKESSDVDFYLDNIKYRSEQLSKKVADYQSIQARFENIADAVAKSTTDFNINGNNLKPSQILNELVNIFAREDSETYELLLSTFSEIDSNNELHNKFKYTVSTLYNKARGT